LRSFRCRRCEGWIPDEHGNSVIRWLPPRRRGGIRLPSTSNRLSPNPSQGVFAHAGTLSRGYSSLAPPSSGWSDAPAPRCSTAKIPIGHGPGGEASRHNRPFMTGSPTETTPAARLCSATLPQTPIHSGPEPTDPDPEGLVDLPRRWTAAPARQAAVSGRARPPSLEWPAQRAREPFTTPQALRLVVPSRFAAVRRCGHGHRDRLSRAWS